MEKKYELTSLKSIISGTHVLRIRALRDFGAVKAGDLGGFVQSETNLSHDGNCWVHDNAMVFDQARVESEAHIFGQALIYENAVVFGGTAICDRARVYGRAAVYGRAVIRDDVSVFGEAKVCGTVIVLGSTVVRGAAKLLSGEFSSGVWTLDQLAVEQYNKEAVRKSRSLP